MNQIKYLFKDIKNNKLIFTLLILINIIGMFLISNSLNLIKDISKSLENLEFFSNKNAYIVEDSTSDLEIQKIFSDDSALDKMEEYFKKIYNNKDITFSTQFGYDMYVSSQGSIVKQTSITDNFFELFNIKAIEGRLFTEEDYNKDTEIVPIIIGYDLRSEFEIYETYTFENGGNGEEFQGEIIGVLAKNSIFYQLSNINVPMSLDSSYIIPLGAHSFNKNNMSISDFDMGIGRMVIFGEEGLESLVIAMNDMDLFNITLKDANDLVEEILRVGRDQLILIGIIILIVLVLVIISTVLGFNRLIKKQLSEYGIHMLCGGTATKLIARFAILIYSILLLSIVIVSISGQSLYNTLFMLIIDFILGLIILIYPYYKLTRLNITEIVNKEKV